MVKKFPILLFKRREVVLEKYGLWRVMESIFVVCFFLKDCNYLRQKLTLGDICVFCAVCWRPPAGDNCRLQTSLGHRCRPPLSASGGNEASPPILSYASGLPPPPLRVSSAPPCLAASRERGTLRNNKFNYNQ